MFIAVIVALTAYIAQAAPAGVHVWTSSDIAAKAKALAQKLDAQKVAAETIATEGNRRFMIAHREGSGLAEWHEKEADVIVISSGETTLVYGGTVADGKTTAPGEVRGPSIRGGTEVKLRAGDVYHIPAKVAHQMKLDAGKHVTYFVTKVVEAAQPAGGGRANTGPVRGPGGEVIGFTNLAEIPGTPWRIHDAARPHPPVVAPGATPGAPPADAILLFDGKSLSRWTQQQKGGGMVDATWPVRDGYFETGAGAGSIYTREKFGDVQLHLEFATPSPAAGASQNRGNSGVKFMGLYEVQVLDSYENVTYADGQAGSIYGEHPPLVNVARKPGEWQTYDIVFEAPKFKGATLVAPAYVTVFWNGVLVHHRRAIMGNTSPTTTPHTYTAHEPELPLMLQDHAHPVRYRNVWIRRLAGYDTAGK